MSLGRHDAPHVYCRYKESPRLVTAIHLDNTGYHIVLEQVNDMNPYNYCSEPFLRILTHFYIIGRCPTGVDNVHFRFTPPSLLLLPRQRSQMIPYSKSHRTELPLGHFQLPMLVASKPALLLR